MIEEVVQSLLSTGLPSHGSPPTELVKANHVRVPGDWQNLGLPYVIHFPAAQSPFYSHSGLTPQQEWPYYQISVFASTYSAARTIADAVVMILEGTHNSCEFLFRGMSPAPYEFDTRIQQVVVEFQVFANLEEVEINSNTD